jgi:acetyl-CoA C-acetyltransferase
VTDPRTPVVVGVGQAQQRPDEPSQAQEPIALLAAAARAAADDAGAGRALVERPDVIGVVQMVSWHYPDPGAALARQLKLGTVPRTLTSTTGGNSPQMLLTALAQQIQAGRCDVVLLGGAECVYTRWRARREPKAWLDWAQDDAPPCAEVLGDDRPGSSDYELAHGADVPTTVYPLFETALRARAGRDVESHQRSVSELWSTFAQVAAENPNAWSRTPWSPEEIRTVSADNRMVTFPYPKRMCANIAVDQAAAVVLCSYETARGAGIPDDRLVFPLAGADAHDHYFFTERAELSAAPAIGIASRAALAGAGCDADDVARFDLYSCFPAAVQLAMASVGLAGPAGGDPRPLTVTGGLAFAGGPANNYPMHAIARMVEACRADPGSIGLVHALGWYATKHSVGLYSTNPPSSAFVRIDPAATQAEVDRGPKRAVVGELEGEAQVEATSVVVDRAGLPVVAVLSLLTDDGGRALATCRDTDAASDMTIAAWEGRRVRSRVVDGRNELAV